MPNIFVTHSRYDTALPNFFDKAAGMVDISLLHMEWETLVAPPWRHIRDMLKDCEAIFVIKGPNIARSLYTSNWISYEIGLAAHSRKGIGSGHMDVWAFESCHDQVHFPIPFLTDYVVYDPDSADHIQYVRYILEAYNKREYKHDLPEALQVECCFDTCKITYWMHTVLKSWNCPSCQRFSEWESDVDYPSVALQIENAYFGQR